VGVGALAVVATCLLVFVVHPPVAIAVLTCLVAIASLIAAWFYSEDFIPWCADAWAAALRLWLGRMRAASAADQGMMAAIEAQVAQLGEAKVQVARERHARAQLEQEQRDLRKARDNAARRIAGLNALHGQQEARRDSLTRNNVRSYLVELLDRKNQFAPWAKLVIPQVLPLADCESGDLTAFRPLDSALFPLRVSGGFDGSSVSARLVRVVAKSQAELLVSDCAVYGEPTAREAYCELETYVFLGYDLSDDRSATGPLPSRASGERPRAI
jgi:hypothetical protein